MDIQFSIRLAQATDGERIARLLNSFRQEFGYTTQATVPLPVDHAGPLYVLLAEQRPEELLGLAAVQRCHSLVRGTTFLLLTDIYVRRDFRKHGVATSLINEVMALGRREGCDGLSLIVNDINNAALAMASRAGFTKHNDLLLHCSLV